MFDEDNRSPDRSHEWPRRIVISCTDPSVTETLVVPLTPPEERDGWQEDGEAAK